MKKERLLSMIDRALRIEEYAVETLTKHIAAAREWVDLSKKESKTVLEELDRLNAESIKHKKMLESAKDMITKGNKDDY